MPNLTKLVLASIFIAQTFAENYNDPKKEEPPKKEPISYKDEDLWRFCDCFEIRDELGLLDYKYDTKPDSKPDGPNRRLANYDPYGYNQEPEKQYYEEPKKDGCGADCSKSYKEVEDCRAREDYDKKVKRDEEDKEIHEERMRHDSYHNSKYDKEEGARRRKEDQERKDKRDREDDDERRKRDDEDYQCYGKRPDYAKDNGEHKGGDSSSSSEEKKDYGEDKNGGYSDKEYENYPDYKDQKDPKYNEYGNEQYKDTKYYDEPKKDEKSGGSDSSSSSSSSSSSEKGGNNVFYPKKEEQKGTGIDKRKRNRQLKKIYYSLDAWERYDLCYCEWSTSSTFEPKYKDYGKSGNDKNSDYNKNSRMQALNDYMHTSGGATVFFSMAAVLLCIVLVSVGYCFYNKRTKESNIEVANLETVVKENSIEMNTVGVTDGEMIEIET